MGHKYLLSISMFLLLPSCLFSEVMTLKDGTTVDALELSKTNDSFLVMTKYGEMTVNTQDIVVSSESQKLQVGLDRNLGEFYGLGTKDKLLTLTAGKVVSQNLLIGVAAGYGYSLDTANEDRFFGADIFKVIPMLTNITLGLGIGVYVKQDKPSSVCGNICPNGICPTCDSKTETVLSPSASIYYAISRKTYLGIGVHASLGPTFQLAIRN